MASLCILRGVGGGHRARADVTAPAVRATKTVRCHGLREHGYFSLPVFFLLFRRHALSVWIDVFVRGGAASAAATITQRRGQSRRRGCRRLAAITSALEERVDLGHPRLDIIGYSCLLGSHLLHLGDAGHLGLHLGQILKRVFSGRRHRRNVAGPRGLILLFKQYRRRISIQVGS